jgi:hypothetical protein
MSREYQHLFSDHLYCANRRHARHRWDAQPATAAAENSASWQWHVVLIAGIRSTRISLRRRHALPAALSF